ncbi:TPA: hypothetical protein N0F65_007279 [Lagenidium giganteum]|uniref:Uncharacterized protein n=1 Tax=Lagenidium giganteum TaxID=4803 RepID=A0AAV2Z6S8_9STRA|nr:TPA: hypothetical protein N0F65_007279 [Lagenidium giganteum]
MMEEYDLRRDSSTLDSCILVDQKAQQASSWIDWIVMDDLPLNICDKPRTRKNTNLKPIESATLFKYMNAQAQKVINVIKAQLAGQRLGLQLDGWTEVGTHYMAIIASKPAPKFISCFSSLEDESDMGADSIIELLGDMFDLFAILASQLCFWCPTMHQIDRSDDAMTDLLPTAREDVQMQHLYEDRKKLESVNQTIQSSTITRSRRSAGCLTASSSTSR